MGGSALASDGGAAALAWMHRRATASIIGSSIVSDRLTEPRSLMRELIVAPRQER